ncbi:MAG: ArsR/SmtB family transcription factor [Desulfovibrionaceae bacterium]
MNQFVKVMKALSDPGRVKIIKMLGQGEMCVCEVTPTLGLAQPTVSKHLKILEEAGLVVWRKEGSWAMYRLADTPPVPYAATMLELLSHWLDRDPQISATLDTAQRIRSEARCARESAPSCTGK